MIKSNGLKLKYLHGKTNYKAVPGYKQWAQAYKQSIAYEYQQRPWIMWVAYK